MKYRLENTYSVLGAGSTPDICGRLLQIQNIYVNYRPSYLQGGSICYFETNDAQPAQTYFMNYGTTKLVKSEEFYYDNEDETKFIQKTSITDYVPNYYFPRVSHEIVNTGEIRGKKYFYPFDFGIIPATKTGELLAIRRMQEKNELNSPIEEVSYRKNNLTATDSLISGAKLTSYYSYEDASVPAQTYSVYRLPSSIYLLESQAFNAFTTVYQPSSDMFVASPASYSADLPRHSLYDKKITMNAYDVYGNLSEYTITHGERKDSFGYQQYNHNGVQLNILTSMGLDGFGLNHQSYYNYTVPLLGLSSSQAPNGVFTYFEYDSFGRLKTLKDHENMVLKEYAYDFSNRSVTEWMPRVALTAVSNTTATNDATKMISYVDGLGRDLQKILVNGSPDATKDIILSSVVYDAYGRGTKAYLPTPSITGGGTMVTDVQTPAKAFYDNDEVPYTETTLFDNSPLNRPLTQYGAGNAWRIANKAVTMQYKVAPAGTIKRFKASLNAVYYNIEGNANQEEYYGADELRVKVMLSERGNKTTEYLDLQGRTVQKDVEVSPGIVQSVIYVYDLFDRLSYVISPKAYALFTSTRTFILDSETDFLEGIYAYKYDRKGQNILKHVAGHTGFEAMVYDQLYRLVLSRDAGDDEVVDAFGRSRWKFTKFDALDRPVMTGLTFLTQGYSPQTLQDDFDNHPPNQINEVRGTVLQSYANYSFPSNCTPLDANIRSLNYFDNYTWQINTDFNFNTTNALGTQWANSKKGLMTGKLLKNMKTSTYQKMVSYYDFKGRGIQNYHFTDRGNLVRKDNQYRFNGELLKTSIEKKNGATALSNKEFIYEYDHISRKTKFKHSTNGVLQNVTTYKFDAIGRLQGKSFKASDVVSSKQTGNWTDVSTWLSNGLPTVSDVITINAGQTVTIPNAESASAGKLVNNGVLEDFGKLNFGTIGSNPLHEITYKYHIRGGLKGINTDANNNLTNSLFSYRLEYENDGNYYDGNIRKQTWKSNIDNIQRDYTHSYDGESRLKSSLYTSTKTGENYALNNVNYDANGNITNLSRNGLKSDNSFGLIDNLNYTYNTNSNKILKVDDVSNETASFRDITGNDYEYWADGSLKKDNNKDITLIEYNYLKLPEKITLTGSRWIEYQYDAGGTKLKKTLSTGKYTDYEEEDIYEDGILYQTSHDEGRIVDGIYEYNITDHLGNLRVAFKDSSGIAKITQVNVYGAFGDDLPTLKYVNSAKKNRFGFNLKEEENDFGIGYNDFKWRFSDQILGRFFTIDRLAEKFSNISTYQFASNDPVNMLEIDGLEGIRHDEIVTNGSGKPTTKTVADINIFVGLSSTGYSKDDIPNIKSNLNNQYNQGFKVDGKEVQFNFNMQSFDADKISVKDKAKEILKDSKVDGVRNGVPVTAVTSMAIVQDGTMSAGQQGSTNVNGTRISSKADDIRHTETHEIGHFMLQGSSKNPDTHSSHDSMGGIFKYKIIDENGNTIQPTENVNKNNVKNIIQNIPIRKD